MKKRFCSVLLALIMISGVIPVGEAAASGGAQGVVDAAKGYLEQDYAVGSYFGGGAADWCGRFLYRCAEDAGESAALCGSLSTMKSTNGASAWFVSNGCAVGYFYNTVSYGNYGMNTNHLMSKSSYTPKLGDIIFYDWDGSPSNFGHMEFVTGISGRTITTIGGSTGGSCTKRNWNGQYHVHAHSYDISSSYIVGFARPNYGGASSSPVAPPTAESQLLLLPATEPGEHRTPGSPFYFRGKATSNYNIISSTVQVRGEDNMTVIMEKTVSLNKTEMDVLKDGMDSLKFGSLPVGNYNFWWLVKDASGTLKSWVSHFSVGDPAPVQKPNCDNGHTWRDWVTEKEAACEADGQSQRVCSVCNATENKVIPAKGHDYVKNGTAEVCSVCGAIKEDAAKLPLSVQKTDYYMGFFNDVKNSDWFSSNVQRVYEYGLMNGVGSKVFAPKSQFTLAEAVALAVRLRMTYETGSCDLPRYDSGNWYDPYVDYAHLNGIIDSVSQDFKRPATREECIHILAKALPEKEFPSTVGTISFADDDSISYLSDVNLLVGAGIVNGLPENGKVYFRPRRAITRAEMAALVTRMADPNLRLR